jgi:hypothetical protein
MLAPNIIPEAEQQDDLATLADRISVPTQPAKDAAPDDMDDGVPYSAA